MEVNVCVIGAGIIGLSTAVNLTELHVPGKTLRVTLIAGKFSPHTTGDGSGGLWQPHLLGQTPRDKFRKWSAATFKNGLQLAKSPKGPEVGCSLLSGCTLHILKPGESEMEELPFWKDIVLDFKLFSASDMRRHKHTNFAANSTGFTYTTIVTEVPKYLPWLLKRFVKNGGIVIQRKVQTLDELAGPYDIAVNCTGLGSRDLVPDTKARPVRGQLVLVEAPWIKQFTFTANTSDDDVLYIIPKERFVVLGGTHEYDRWDRTPSDKERRRILEGCTKIEPSLKNAKIIGEWVGLRPARTGVRLEKEIVPTKNGMLTVVHNYGHGGSGVSMHWGCALEAKDLVKQCVQQSQGLSLTARL